MIKVTFCLRRLPHLSREQFQDYWRNVHAPLVAQYAEILNIQRYVQSHTLDDAAVAGLAVPRGSPPAYDGVAELWIGERREDASREEARRANRILLEDEKKFIDLAHSPIFYSRSHEILKQAS
jgi:uncharacterized protein (TIGR02118 family)